MFSDSDITRLRQSPYGIAQINRHDVTLHSELTGHDWVIVSYYDSSECYILHRHSRRDPYHRQKGNYKTLNDALDYIIRHEKWFGSNEKVTSGIVAISAWKAHFKKF